MTEARNTIHLVSLGCVKNRVDSEVMLGVAEEAGLTAVARPEDAEVIVVNTCGFIGEAKKESIETIFEMDAGAKGVPVLAVTGGHTMGNESLRMAETAGANLTMEKDFTPEQLLEAVKGLLAARKGA